jgi:hypothetical protein
MREADYAPFCELLDDVWGLKGQALTGGQKAVFFKALAEHSLVAVRAGLNAHVKDPERGRFLPMPADVIAQIVGAAHADGRPGPEEAWATAIKAADERETVVWTDEAAAAWGIARPVFDMGDEVGARMAFKEAYQRLVAESRALMLPPAWRASLGHDAERRVLPIEAAANAGLLPAPEAAALLPGPRVTSIPEPVRALLQELRSRLANGEDAPSHDAEAKRRTAEAKAAAAQRVADYEAGDDSRQAPA